MIEQALLLPLIMKLHMGFILVYLDLTVANSNRQLRRWNSVLPIILDFLLLIFKQPDLKNFRNVEL